MSQFQYLPWFNASLTDLLKRFEQNTFPQSLLMTGEPDIGKTSFAHDIAKGILCLNRTDHIACGQCQSCIWMDKKSHPDFCAVSVEDKSSVIKIDQVRSLIQFSYITSETGRKVIVIEQADAMNINAANALLKTLEEPVANCYIILVTSYPKKLPITIVSRCQRQNLSLQDHHELVLEWLRNQFPSVDAGNLQQVIEWTYGRPILSHQFLSMDAMTVIKTLEAMLSRYLHHKNNVEELVDCIVKNWHIASHMLLYWIMQAIKGNMADDMSRLFLNNNELSIFSNYEQLIKLMELSSTPVRQDWLVQEWLLKLTD